MTDDGWLLERHQNCLSLSLPLRGGCTDGAVTSYSPCSFVNFDGLIVEWLVAAWRGLVESLTCSLGWFNGLNPWIVIWFGLKLYNGLV